MKLLKRFLLGEGQTNCYLIEVKDKIVLIDAGQNPQKVIDYVDNEQLTIDEVWLTHTHFDHIMGLEELVSHYNINKVYVSPKEQSFLANADENLSTMANFNFEYHGKVTAIDNKIESENDVKVIYISGHSCQSAVFYFEQEKLLFSGDTLFRGTIGRSDFKHGNHQLLTSGLRDNLFTLDNEVKVYPGHGFSTSIGQEKEDNMYKEELNVR